MFSFCFLFMFQSLVTLGCSFPLEQLLQDTEERQVHVNRAFLNTGSTFVLNPRLLSQKKSYSLRIFVPELAILIDNPFFQCSGMEIF